MEFDKPEITFDEEGSILICTVVVPVKDDPSCPIGIHHLHDDVVQDILTDALSGNGQLQEIRKAVTAKQSDTGKAVSIRMLPRTAKELR